MRSNCPKKTLFPILIEVTWQCLIHETVIFLQSIIRTQLFIFSEKKSINNNPSDFFPLNNQLYNKVR